MNLSRWQNIWNNYFQPRAYVLNVKNWLEIWDLSYVTSKTLAVNVFAYNAVAVGNTTVNFMAAPTILSPQQNAADEHMMITEIDFYDGAAATLNATPWALGITDALGKQGYLSVSNSGTIELKNLPLTQFIPATNDSDSGKFQLNKPIMWVAQTDLIAQITYPTAPATANYNVRMEIVGLKLI